MQEFQTLHSPLPTALLTKRLRRSYIPVNFVKFVRIPSLKKT